MQFDKQPPLYTRHTLTSPYPFDDTQSYQFPAYLAVSLGAVVAEEGCGNPDADLTSSKSATPHPEILGLLFFQEK